MKSIEGSYLLCACGLFGFCGIHRFYLGKPVTGLIWLLTYGLFGVGQIIDIFLIPSMVEAQNLKLNPSRGNSLDSDLNSRTFKKVSISSDICGQINKLIERLDEGVNQLISNLINTNNQTKQQILSLISSRSEATRNELVLALKKEPKVIDRLLTQMQCEELIEVGNRDRDGAIVYRVIV